MRQEKGMDLLNLAYAGAIVVSVVVAIVEVALAKQSA
jgi:hypothetical protein